MSAEKANVDGKVDFSKMAEAENVKREEVHKVDLSNLNQENNNNNEEKENVRLSDEKENNEEGNEEAGNKEGEEKILEDDLIVEILDEEGEGEGEEEGKEEVTPPKGTTNIKTGSSAAEDKTDLPEGLEDLAKFMKETGGSLEDYMNLNKDISSLSEEQLLQEYHSSVEPDLTKDEINFLMEDLYEVSDEFEDERLKTKKSIAKKRTLAKARKHFEGNKEKYYKEVKAGSKLLPEQQKAIEFFNRYTKDQEETSKLNTQKAEVFTQKTNALFNEEFKGFEFKVGDKRFRYNVKDANSVKESQATLENFTKKYLGDDNTLSDAKGYHKALFTAMNADSIADHFYKQGKADALKVSASRKKNINMEGRQDHNNNQNTQSGLRAKVVENDSPRPGKLTFKKY